MSDLLYPLRRMHGNYVEKKFVWKYLNLPFGPKNFIIGTPEYSNLGDSAIAIAEKKFLIKYFGREQKMKELTFREYPRYHDLISKVLSPHSCFFGMGGGNTGDQWYRDEVFQRITFEETEQIPCMTYVWHTNLRDYLRTGRLMDCSV